MIFTMNIHYKTTLITLKIMINNLTQERNFEIVQYNKNILYQTVCMQIR